MPVWDKSREDDYTFSGCNLRFSGKRTIEREKEKTVEFKLARQGKARQGKRDGKGSLSNDGRARKLATFAPRKSYEGFVAELLMNIKGHYNGDKLWPLSRAIFMLSIPRNVEPLKIQGSNHND